MTMFVVLAAALGLGLVVRGTWLIVAPVAAAAALASVLAWRGADLSDTPIPFLVVIVTALIGIGRLIRARRSRPTV